MSARLARSPRIWVLVAAIGAFAWAYAAAGSFATMWLTPDQRGALAMRDGDNAAAATRFRDPILQGAALYRDGRFKEAATAFARVDSPTAAYDRGNALVMLGKYADAIASYDRALASDPGMQAAETNRAVAVARRDSLAATGDGSEDTEGKEKADATVFDDRAKQSTDASEEAGGPPAAADADVQALWLRRVQTRPADFLRAKFAYQLSVRQAADPGVAPGGTP